MSKKIEGRNTETLQAIGRELQKKFEPQLTFLERATQSSLDEPKGIEGIGGLYVDLVPSTCWYSNIRSLLSTNDWLLISNKVYANANNRCDICKGFGINKKKDHAVEAHERWVFNWDTKTQELLRIESLCPACHRATHYGYSKTKGFEHVALERLLYVNGWSENQANIHIKKSYDIYNARSELTWKLDMSWLFNFMELDSKTKQLIEDVKNGKVERS